MRESKKVCVYTYIHMKLRICSYGSSLLLAASGSDAAEVTVKGVKSFRPGDLDPSAPAVGLRFVGSPPSQHEI